MLKWYPFYLVERWQKDEDRGRREWWSRHTGFRRGARTVDVAQPTQTKPNGLMEQKRECSVASAGASCTYNVAISRRKLAKKFTRIYQERRTEVETTSSGSTENDSQLVLLASWIHTCYEVAKTKSFCGKAPWQHFIPQIIRRNKCQKEIKEEPAWNIACQIKRQHSQRAAPARDQL